MVTRSPFSACVKSAASVAGRSRTGTIGSEISNSSPATKRAALTLPSRCFAARSARAGVRRGSPITLSQQCKNGARGLAFAALRSRRLGVRRPAVDVDMQPAFHVDDEPLQEKRACDRACERARGSIVHVGNFRVEPAIVSRPKRKPPQRIILLFRMTREIHRELLIVGVKRRQI